jgi:basic membrane protein A
MKRIFMLLVSLVLVFALTAPVPVKADPVTVTLVLEGGLGDKSLYDSAYEGLQMLVNEFQVNAKVVECKQDASQFTPQLAAAAQESNYVVAVGRELYEGLQVAAPAAPGVKFIYVDQALEGIPNLLSITYAANEGSFLAGYVAAKLSKSHKVGAVGGMNDAATNDFLAGYRQGARYAVPSISVESYYTRNYQSPKAGRDSATALIDRGCDVLFAVTGKSGEGVIETAAKEGKYVIGSDADQKYINPDVVVASMKKNVGLSIYTAIKNDIATGVWNGGSVWLADMAGGFVDIGYGAAEMAQQVSDELKAQVENIKQMIINKEIVVDTAHE